MKFIAILLILYIVPTVLSHLSNKKADTKSIMNFEMRPSNGLAPLGIIGAGFFLFCIIGAYIANQLDGFLIAVFGGLFLISILLILATIKGFWDVAVDGDTVTSSRIWIIKKTINIHDIDYCVYSRGEYEVHIKGHKRSGLSIDSMSSNTQNWEKRMASEHIEIKYKGK